ncbi:MAG: hypothetical protein LBS24_05225, partial [Clostridiales Family XIII bacterium]|nr:hypothetical protein [Clostridiales Family XIII bacterium]
IKRHRGGDAFSLSEKTTFRALCFIMPFSAAESNVFCEKEEKFGCIYLSCPFFGTTQRNSPTFTLTKVAFTLSAHRFACN